LDVHLFYGRDPEPPTLAVPEPGAATAGSRILAAYPNPSHGSLQVRFRSSSTGHADLALYDLAGRRRKTLRSEPSSAPGEMMVSASTAGLAPGVYFLRLASTEGSDLRRIVLLK
jgi:hypothetical protein